MPLKLIYSDVWGRTALFFFFDHFTKFIWLFSLKQKYDVELIFLQFQAHVEHNFDTKI